MTKAEIDYLSKLYIMLAKMRLTTEGALHLYEDEIPMAFESYSIEAQALNAMGVALYTLRELILSLQQEFPKEPD